MEAEWITLMVSCALAVTYGAFYCWSDNISTVRTVVKTGGVLALAVTAFLAGGPMVLVFALAISAAGDAFLAGQNEKWLLPGMAAFFAAHVAYIALFLELGATVPAGTGALLGVQAGMIGPLIAFLYWVSKSAGNLAWPGRAYGVAILAMGLLAVSLWSDYPLVTVGAQAFILSDMLLSVELFKPRKDARKSVPQSLVIWGAYFGGQLMIALGILQMV